MLLVLICVAIPVAILGILTFVRSQCGEGIFRSDWPPHELNRSNDHRLIKLHLGSSPQLDAHRLPTYVSAILNSHDNRDDRN